MPTDSLVPDWLAWTLLAAAVVTLWAYANRGPAVRLAAAAVGAALGVVEWLLDRIDRKAPRG